MKKTQKKIQTRSTSKIILREKEEIFNNYLLDDDIIEIDKPKLVRFDI